MIKVCTFMEDYNIWERIWIFIKSIPSTLKETFIWFGLTYFIPIVNIGIIWAMRREEFGLDLSILNIIIVTNACFLTSIFNFLHSSDKKRKLINMISIITYAISIVLFSISIIQIAMKSSIFEIDIYMSGTWITFIISLFLGLICKYDEVGAISINRAQKSKETKATEIEGHKVKL